MANSTAHLLISTSSAGIMFVLPFLLCYFCIVQRPARNPVVAKTIIRGGFTDLSPA